MQYDKSVSVRSYFLYLDVTQWPPAVASLLAAEKEKQLLEVGKLKREKMEAFVDGTAASATSAAAEADYQSKLARLEEKIQLLSGEIERYQVLSGIEGLGSGGGAVGENRTSVTTSTTDLLKEKESSVGKWRFIFFRSVLHVSCFFNHSIRLGPL